MLTPNFKAKTHLHKDYIMNNNYKRVYIKRKRSPLLYKKPSISP